MAVLHKVTVDQALKDLDHYYAQLRSLLDCKPLGSEEACFYSHSPGNPDVVYVFMDDLMDSIGHMKVSLDSLKKLKSKSLKPSRGQLYDPRDA